MAYFGPGSTGATNKYQSPIVHGVANSPFQHTNRQLDTETGKGWGDRITREYAQRGFQALPEAWDVTNPGGVGVGGTGAFAPPSPFLFPGQLPSQGVKLPNGQVATGSVGADGQIFGSLSGGAQPQGFSGYASGQPAGNQIGSVNSIGGSGSLSFGGGVPSNPSPDQADALLNQQRELAFGRLRSVDDIFNSRLGELTDQALQRQIQGTDVPFTDQRMEQMEARLAAQATSADRGRRSRIREQFAGRGLGGSGLQFGAEQASMAEASAQRGANLNNLLIQQGMENWTAQERARQGAQQWLSSKAAGIMPSILKEADMRSRFEVTGDGGADQDIANALTTQALGSIAGPGQGGAAAFNTTLPFGPGSTGNISTPGGPPIRATGGVQGGFPSGSLVTQAGQGGGPNAAALIAGLFGSGAIQGSQTSNYNPYAGTTTPQPAPLQPQQQPQQPFGGVPNAAPQADPFAWLNSPGPAQTGPSFLPFQVGGNAL